MPVDLSGGFDESREFVFAEQPDDPEMRESVNAWLWGSGDAVGMPRIGVEAVADQWDTHDIQVNLAYGDGRVYTEAETVQVMFDYGKGRVKPVPPEFLEKVRDYIGG